MGEKLVTDAINTVGFRPDKEIEPRKSFFSSLTQKTEEMINLERKENLINNDLGGQESMKVSKVLFKINDNENENSEESGEEEKMEQANQISNSKDFLTPRVMIRENLSHNSINESFEGSMSDSQSSELSSAMIKDIQRRRKKIDLNLLKSKRKTINMRLAFLSPSNQEL